MGGQKRSDLDSLSKCFCGSAFNMAEEQTFHTILVISALLLFPVAIYHRVQSQSTGARA
jgi:hypothetical protein